MPERTLLLRVTDVDQRPIVDPTVFVRIATPDNQRSATERVALNGEPKLVRFADGPTGFALNLRVSPSRYRDGMLTASVDGDGLVTPTAPIRLPRRPSEWLPAFTAWRLLPAAFGRLQRVLDGSPFFRVGRMSAPDLFVRDRYDAVDPLDESRVLAKLCLLNLYARLREEPVPVDGGPWFDLVQELYLATRERFIARVDRACWARVRDLEKHPRDGFKKTPVGDHKDNLEEIPGVSQVRDLASIKTREAKANLQFTVARAQKDGETIFLLDTDLDENGKLLPHTFDLIAHAFTGGTHPIDIHESLRAARPDLDFGYGLEPRQPIADTSARVIAVTMGAAPSTPELAAAAAAVTMATPRRIAVVGDSVPWGQGLLNAQKIHTIVGDALASGGRFPATTLVAHSGATIGVGVTQPRPPVDGEVPKAHPTILQQIADYPSGEAADADLVILNGGINDVDVRFILNPFTEPSDLEDTTRRACGPDLVDALRAAAARFPVARVAVLEYYPILSPQSRVSWGIEFLLAAGAPPPASLMIGPTAAFLPFWDRIVDNCRIFHVTSSTAIRAAVATVNAEMPGGRFVSIDPGFTDGNAALAPSAWLFGINWDLSPQDPVAQQRRQACLMHEHDLIRRESCFRASSGHPNALGAMAYAAAILTALAA